MSQDAPKVTIRQKPELKSFRLSWLTLVWIFVCLVLIASAVWCHNAFGFVGFEQIMFHLREPLEGSNSGPIFTYLAYAIPLPLIVVILLGLYVRIPSKDKRLTSSAFAEKLAQQAPKATVKPDSETKTMVLHHDSEHFFRWLNDLTVRSLAASPLKSMYPIRCLLLQTQKGWLSLLSLLAVIAFLVQFGVVQFAYATLNESSYMRTKFVDTEQVELQFPEQKRNLVYIFMESMEASYVSTLTGGGYTDNYIPKLEKLALDNYSFSDKAQGIGGARQVSSVGWTVAGMVAQSSGLPLKTPVIANNYGFDGEFLPGMYNLGDVLEKEGYNLKLLMGSDKKFGARDTLYTKHGHYDIEAWKELTSNGTLPVDYNNKFWGVEDEKLFAIAKQRLTEMSKQEQPFALTLLTVDTHFPTGYLYETDDNPFDTSYGNSLYNSDKRVTEFIAWLQQQPFYKNTTIVLSGDHLTMANDFVKSKQLKDDYERTVYNCVVNPAPSALANYQNGYRYNRLFSTMDMFPTTLAAMGVQIPGQRLGYGTNLFSGVPTVPEEIGWQEFKTMMEGYSSFYNKRILRAEK